MKTLLTVLLALSLLAPVFAGEWITETVDSAGDVGRNTSMALDSSDKPSIVYEDKSNYDVKFAQWNGSSWQIEAVFSTGYFEIGTLSLDSSDVPHIACHDFANRDLEYASWDGSNWQLETVDSTGNVGYHPFMVVDSSDNPHFSYTNQSGQLKYATWAGSNWHVEIIDTTDSVHASSLATDSSCYPHIAYYHHDSDELTYTHWDGTSWQIETVDLEVGYPYFTSNVSISVDSNDFPHIAYYDDDSQYLKYAHWDGSAWQIEIVDSAGFYGSWVSMALDSSDYPHISYYDENPANYDHMYARWDGSAWHTETVETTGDVGNYCSIAIDSSGNPHISHFDWDNKDLRYTYWSGGAAVDSASLSVNAKDEGVLLSWSIVGDTPASVSVLRGLTQNGSVDISGSLSGSATSWLDVSVEAGVEYAYWLEVTELDGTVSRFGPSEIVVPEAISKLTLSDPYPNPASSALTISYELATDGAVSLSVYDLSGRLVETLISGEQTAGRHSVNWDSSTSATGVYLIRLEADGEAITKRAVISR